MKESSQQRERERERERERRNISLLSQKHSSYYVKDYGGNKYILVLFLAGSCS